MPIYGRCLDFRFLKFLLISRQVATTNTTMQMRCWTESWHSNGQAECRNISLNQRNHNIGLSTSTKYKKQVENSRNILCQWLASETKGGNMQLRPRDKEVRRQNYTWSRAKANYLHVNKRTHTNILILNLNAPKYFGWHIAKRRNKQKVVTHLTQKKHNNHHKSRQHCNTKPTHITTN